MKKFLLTTLFLLFAGSAFSYAELPVASNGDLVKYEDYIIKAGDTVKTVNTFGTKRIEITVVDSSDSKTDSLYVLQGTGDASTVYSKVSLLDAEQTTKTTNIVLIPSVASTDGTTKTYIVTGSEYVTEVRIVRLNVGSTSGGFPYAPRTKIFIKKVY